MLKTRFVSCRSTKKWFYRCIFDPSIWLFRLIKTIFRLVCSSIEWNSFNESCLFSSFYSGKFVNNVMIKFISSFILDWEDQLLKFVSVQINKRMKMINDVLLSVLILCLNSETFRWISPLNSFRWIRFEKLFLWFQLKNRRKLWIFVLLILSNKDFDLINSVFSSIN